jgi:isochorismate hydrolase
MKITKNLYKKMLNPNYKKAKTDDIQMSFSECHNRVKELVKELNELRDLAKKSGIDINITTSPENYSVFSKYVVKGIVTQSITS